MKRILLLSILMAATAFAHERIVLGPNGGRVVYVDSAAIPHVEFRVNAEGRAKIALLDKTRSPIPLTQQEITVTAGPRSSAVKLAVEKIGNTFVTDPVPAGAPYYVVIQIRETPSTKPVTARVYYDHKPGKSGKPAYLDDSINAGSGAGIVIPNTLQGMFVEINEHLAELKEGFGRKRYETVEEAVEALTVLLKALPEKSGEKTAAVEPKVTALVRELAAIAEANASRDLAKARANYDTLMTAMDALKKDYPENIANAKPDQHHHH